MTLHTKALWIEKISLSNSFRKLYNRLLADDSISIYNIDIIVFGKNYKFSCDYSFITKPPM